ncbi:MAG: S8 family serine peptidase, partial [bacterium]|nr:S8 family serine peptidase [bacterium]
KVPGLFLILSLLPAAAMAETSSRLFGGAELGISTFQFDKKLDKKTLKKIRAKVVDKIKNQAGVKKRDLDLISGSVIEIKAKHLDKIAEDAGVRFINLDHNVTAAMDYSVPAIGADIAFNNGWDGSGIGVAVIDSGVSRHKDIGDRRVYSERFGAAEKKDPYGHGTHVAGIIAGDGRQDGVQRGVAPGANIINLAVLDHQGAGMESDVIAAIQRAVELKDTYNIRVLNLSLGRPVSESFVDDPLCQAVQAAWEAGITVVVSAGNEGRDNSFENEGYGTISAPGNSPYVITVGGMKTRLTPERGDDQIASYSSKGPTLVDHVVKPDLVGPGNRVVSLR